MLSEVAREETEYVPPAKKAKSLGYSAEWKLWKVLSVIKFSDTKQKQKLITILFKPVHKVVLVFRRIMANYTYQEGAVTPIQDITEVVVLKPYHNFHSAE